MTEFNPAEQLSQQKLGELGTRVLQLGDQFGITERIVNYGIDHVCLRTE